nr:immunoglobulin light chain junction region [Macaca mulatta]MOX08375.1 immunoglobulin light chain junction region [Macaca mulatta]
CQQGYTDPPTF